MSLTILPTDVFNSILLNLPTSQICRVKRTCKLLNKVGSEPSFWKLICRRDFQQYSINELEYQFSSFLFAYKILSIEEATKRFHVEVTGREIRKKQLILVPPYRNQPQQLGKVIDIRTTKTG